MSRRSLIVPLSRFESSVIPFEDEEVFSNSIHLRKKRFKKSKPESECTINEWFIKSHSETDDRTAPAIETYAGWCYQLFVDNGYTQPKHYLLKNKHQYYVASKRIEDFKKISEIYVEFPTLDGETKLSKSRRFIEGIFIRNRKNCQLFANILVEFIRQGGNDFRLAHLGLDNTGHLVRIDFDQANVALTYDIEKLNQDRVRHGKSPLSFSITAEDLERVPVFEDYKPVNNFINLFSAILVEEHPQSVFSEISDSPCFRRCFHRALLKRLIFPEYLEFSALELIGNEEDIQDFTHRQCERDIMLKGAAFAYPDFVQYLRSGDALKDKKNIIIDLNSSIPELRPFRHLNTDEIHKKLQEKIDQKYELLLFDISNKDNQDHDTLLSNSLIRLVHFLENEICRLERKKEHSFFTKGLNRKKDLYQKLLSRIKNFCQNTFNANVINWFKEASLIAHHRRFSKCNTIFFHRESSSWMAFKKLIHEVAKDNRNFENLINSKSHRAIEQEGQLIDSYNAYRSFCK